MLNIPDCYYRISIKSLILDDSRQKFLVTLEDNGMWELPGGGLDRGETAEECLRREIREEMGLTITEIKRSPCYVTSGNRPDGNWFANIVYEVRVKDLHFIPSSECREIKFVTADEAQKLDAFPSVKHFARAFDPKNHIL